MPNQPPSYIVKRVREQPDWRGIAAQALTHDLWAPDPAPPTAFQCAYSQDILFCRMLCEEISPRAVNRAPDSAVWEDSCMEWFVSPEGSPGYLNMEVNANGALLCGFGKSRHGRLCLRDTHTPLPQVWTARHTGSWEVRLRLPLATFCALFGPTVFTSGMHIRANFYKCGDKTPRPHYASWAPIPLPAPDFHCPEFFGLLILE